MSETQKFCKKCNQFKVITEFGKNKKLKSGINSYCKDCCNAHSNAWRVKNPNYHKEYFKENEDYLKKWRANNEGYFIEYYASNREHLLELSKTYAKSLPDKGNANVACLRAKKLNCLPPWLTETHFEEMKNFYIKAQQLSEETGIKYEVDHIHPLQSKVLCGLHVPWNLQIIPASENRKKKNKIIV